MNEYVIDARMIHAFTLTLLSNKKYQTVVCVSDDIAHDYPLQKIITSYVGDRVNCVFSDCKNYLDDFKDNTLIVFDSLTALSNCLNEKIKDITILFTSNWDQSVHKYSEGLYLSKKDIELIKKLQEKKRVFYYQFSNNERQSLEKLIYEK